MFKVLAVICVISGVCEPFMDKTGTSYATLAECDIQAEKVFDAMMLGVGNEPGFVSAKVGCVSVDFNLEN